jgi:hypothetical protein
VLFFKWIGAYGDQPDRDAPLRLFKKTAASEEASRTLSRTLRLRATRPACAKRFGEDRERRRQPLSTAYQFNWSSSGQEIGADFFSHEAYMLRDSSFYT